MHTCSVLVLVERAAGMSDATQSSFTRAARVVAILGAARAPSGPCLGGRRGRVSRGDERDRRRRPLEPRLEALRVGRRRQGGREGVGPAGLSID